jgi:hypothetical protein
MVHKSCKNLRSGYRSSIVSIIDQQPTGAFFEAAMSLNERLRKLDAHSSVSKEFRVYTVHGAVLSVVTVLAIIYLLISEIYFNFQMTLQETVFVNATSARGLEMEFDITLPRVPCSKLRIDAADPQGQPQSLHLDQQHHVWKHRVRFSEDGIRTLIGKRSRLELGSTLKNEKDLIEIAEQEGKIKTATASSSLDEGDIGKDESSEEESKCGSCYGAGEDGECCDSCEDVRRAYKRRGWILRPEVLATVEQCRHEVTESEDGQEGEGCNVHGVVALSTGGGNLHLAPGKEAAISGMTVLDVLMQSFQQWNVSHTIHKIRFGAEYPDAIYQLDGETRSIQDTYGMYQYYFQVKKGGCSGSGSNVFVMFSLLYTHTQLKPSYEQIVPTTYRFFNGATIQTNQYSVTEHLRHVNPGSNRGLPGVFFFYEVSPLHVEINEGYRKGWISFFTSVCAIVGGVVSVMGMVDQYLFSTKQRRVSSELLR